jgi:molybdopterin-guanine dinucleotide biosynthesis protein A
MRMKGFGLAGGKSSRFGEDKALLFWNGTTFIERAVDRIRDLGLEPVVITSSMRDYSFLNCRIEKDAVSDRGPIGGLFTACHLFPNQPLLVLVCDMPSISAGLLEELISKHDLKYVLTVYESPDFGIYPFPGIYHSNLHSELQLRLEMGNLSMTNLITEITQKMLIEMRSKLPYFDNINTKTDFENLIDR